MTALLLRLLALVTMFIDHFGAILHPRELSYRYVGRLSFPIYAFLIANGFNHTHDKKRYLMRLLIFALVSEIPYDLAFNHSVLEFARQNIFFTLALGLVCLMLQEKLTEIIGRIPGSLVALGITAAIAEFGGASYGASGVILIFIFDAWLTKRLPYLALWPLIGILFYSSSQIQFWGVLALIPLYFYNGKPGRRLPWLQWGFYLFYPLHLLLLHYWPW